MSTRNIISCLLFGSVLLAMSCSSKQEHHHDGAHHADHGDTTATEENWKEMDDFHTVMAGAFHPYKDAGDLNPAKESATELAESAQRWKNASLPEKVNNDDTKAKLEHLSQGTAAFVETVKGGDDKVIGEALTELHDLFHELQESWYAGGHGDHHEHH